MGENGDVGWDGVGCEGKSRDEVGDGAVLLGGDCVSWMGVGLKLGEYGLRRGDGEMLFPLGVGDTVQPNPSLQEKGVESPFILAVQ